VDEPDLHKNPIQTPIPVLRVDNAPATKMVWADQALAHQEDYAHI
jgi:hypothetical protein